MERRWTLLGVMGAALALAGCADTYGYGGGYYARTAPPPFAMSATAKRPGRDMSGSTDTGVIAAITTIGFRGDGSVRRAAATAGRMAAGKTAATATSGVKAVGAKIRYG